MPRLLVVAEEAADVVAAKPKVVWVRSLVPKVKNSARLGDLAGAQRGARQLDHRADQVVELRARSGS